MSGATIGGPGPERGMVFQDYGLFPWLTVRGNIGFEPISRKRRSKTDGRSLPWTRRAATICRCLSAPALGRG